MDKTESIQCTPVHKPFLTDMARLLNGEGPSKWEVHMSHSRGSTKFKVVVPGDGPEAVQFLLDMGKD